MRSGSLIECVLLFTALMSWAANPAESAATRFGFTGPEIFPIDNSISHLRSADLDGDGWRDLVVVNNNQSKIHLLYNQTVRTNRVAKRADRSQRELNELLPDARFRIESIAAEKRISSLVLEDLNGDRRPDLACFGEPKDLVVFFNGTNGWQTPRIWPAEAGQLTANALTAGDLNGDGRRDLALLAEDHVLLWRQRPDHTLAEPERLPFSGTIRSLQALDIDGDSRDDLLLVNWEDRNPFRVRFQRPDGQLGPELYFSSPPIRSYWADNLELHGNTQLITIAQNSGRAQVSEFKLGTPETVVGGYRLAQFEVYPLPRTQRARRGLLWADLDADGRQDLIVAEPEHGQVSIRFQQPSGALSTPCVFPTLAGIGDLAAADWDEDGKPELFQLSTDERAVGAATLDANGRLPFPALVQLPGRPLVLAAGKLRTNDKPVLAVVLDRDGGRSVALIQSSGLITVRPLATDYRAAPNTLVFHDTDQDGLTDLVILAPYEKIKVLRQLHGGDFAELDVAPPGGVIEQPWLTAADLDDDGRPELLLTQRSFVRAVVLRPSDAANGNTNRESTRSWAFAVKEQINGAGSNSRLAGATALRHGTDGPPMLCLLDTERKSLSLCERDSMGVWQIQRNVPLPMGEFDGLKSVSFGGGAGKALVFVGLNAVAVLHLDGQAWTLTELDGYETPIKDARLTDVISGDLDNDGRKDLVFLETGRNYLDIVVFNSEHKLVPANRWPVFEERTFRGRRSDLPEPREAVVVEVTGDGKNDLVVLVHDRILLYPQE